MNKTRLLVLLRNIWATKVSFLSIVLFVGLGIGIFLGIRWNGPAIHDTVDAYYEEQKFHDYSVSFPYGITEKDVAAIRALDDVSEAEGGYTADGSVRVGEDTYVLDIQSLTETMDLATASEGELPEAADEVGIERSMAADAGLEIGDVLVIQSQIAGKNSLVHQRFTITGYVEHPSYISRRSSYSRGSASIGDGVVNYYVLMSPAAFEKSAYDGCYSNVYVRCDSLRGLNSYENKYLKRAGTIAGELTELGNERGEARYEAVEGRYQGELDSAQAQLDDGEKQIADGEKTLTEGAKEIDQAQRQIADGEKELAAAEEQLAAGEAEYASKQKEFSAGEALIREGERKLAAAEALYASKKKEFDAGAAQVAEGLNQYQQYRTQLQPVLDQTLTAEVDPPSPMRELRRAVMVKHGLDPDHVEISADPATANGQLDQAVDVTDELDDLVDAMLEEDGEDHVVELQPGKYGPQETQTLDVHITKEELDREKEGLTATRKVMTGTQQQLGVYLDGKAQLDTAREQLNSALSQLQAGRSELADGKAQLETARAQLAAGLAELNQARAQVQEGRDQLTEGKEQLEAKKKELADGRKKLEESKKELEEGRKQLEEARESGADLVEYTSWILEKRADNVDYNVAKGYCDIGRKLCFSLALLFVFVGVMICYTSISRIVQEQQVMTGVEKALGFTEKEILTHYLWYAALTVLLGGLFGGLFGYFLVEQVMNRTLSDIFVVGALRSHFSLLDLLAIMLLELVLIALAAWIACRRQLSRRAIELLRGEKQSNSRTRFYEKLSWWKRVPLYTQMTVNNLMNDKTRMVATLVGVAGCTSLIVMALTFQQALKNTPEKHFSQVSLYDMRLVSDDAVEGAMENLSSALEEEVSYLRAQHRSGLLVDEDGMPHVTDIIVPESPEELGSYFRLRSSSGGGEIELPEEGVLLNKTYTRYHEAKVGDTLRILDTSTGKYHEVKVAGIVEHYLSLNQIFMSPDYYREVMGESPKSNTFYVNLHGADADALKTKLAKVNGYFNFKDDHAKWQRIFSTFQSITSLVVVIALIMSAVMALLVLLNLNVMLIRERTRELIVMRINGFSVRDTKRYVYRDNIVLTALGIILGVGLGMALAVFVIVSASSENSSIITDQNVWACLEAVLITVIFAVITNLIALRQVDKLKVSDLNKL